MKQITYKISTVTGRMALISSSHDVKLSEYENTSTTVLFMFDRPVTESDRLAIEFKNRLMAKPYKLERVDGSKYKTLIPREMLVRGRLEISVHHYDHEFYRLAKYEPETPLYVTAALDITNDVMETRPDLFAELFYENQQMKKEIEILKKEIEMIKARG